MRSITKRDLSRDDIQAILRGALGEEGEISWAEEFTDGWFAAVHGVELVNGTRAVLKVSPPADLRMLRYEVDLSYIESEFYRLAGAAGVPVPEILYADPDRGYLITRWLSGTSLRVLASDLDEETVRRLRREIGKTLARQHSVSAPFFGYLRRDRHTQCATWRESFLTMMDDIVTDAIEYQRDLPMPAESIAKLVRCHADLLDEVTVPALVHGDLWDGNVFVRPEDDGYAIDGIIDGERAFFGDPIADLVCLSGFDDERFRPSIMEGYCGEARVLTDSESVRLRMYTTYFDLIMLTEGAVRCFDPVEHAWVVPWVTGRLRSNLEALSTVASSTRA